MPSNIRPISEPRDPPPSRNPPPRPGRDPGDPSSTTDLFKLSSDTGLILPIAYGTVRVKGILIERYQTQFGSTTALFVQPNTAYTTATGNGVGFIVYSNGNLYVVIAEGTTGGGTPGQLLSGTGTAVTSGTASFSYVAQGYQHFALVAFCEGQIFGFGKAWQDKLVLADYTQIPHVATWLTGFTGTAAGIGTRPTWFGTYSDGVVYADTACLMIVFQNGSDQGLPDLSVEVKGIFTDATHADVNPADIAIDLLTHVRRGLAWPSARVDAVTTGAGAASWRTYCEAAGLRMSWLIDQQTSSKELLQLLMIATSTDPVWTNRPDGLGGMLKFVPRGDQSITGGGTTYTPSFPVQYALSEADFLQPLQVQRIEPSETFNSFPIEYADRAQDYRRNIIDNPEMADVDNRGLRRFQTASLPMVIDPAAAVMLSTIYAQRSLNIRNTYTFKVGFRYLLLEPGDVVTISDSGLGLPATPVRILTKAEDQAAQGGFTFTAQDWPAAVGAAPLVAPQVGDGFKPNTPSDLQRAPVIPINVMPRSMPDTSSTRGGSVDNLWPNPTSENPPPDGADTTAAEWAGLLYLGSPNAYAGNYVRTPGLGANLAISYDVPASPGDSFYMQAQVAAATPSGSSSAGGPASRGPSRLLRFRSAKAFQSPPSVGQGGFVRMLALDSSGNTLASGNSSENDTASFTNLLATLTVPAGTVTVRFQLVNGSTQAAQAYFDAIYCRRQVDPNVVVKLGGTYVDELQAGAMQAIGRNKTGNWPNIVVQRAWYRGSNDPLTKGGAPNISRVSITFVPWDRTMHAAGWAISLTPQTYTDNFDGMRYAKINLYRQNVAGTSGTLTQIGIYNVAINDRLYAVPGTDSDSSNAIQCYGTIMNAGIDTGFPTCVPAVILTVYNVNGPSDSHCFYSGAGWAEGASLIDNGPTFPAGLTGGGAGGSGGGTGDGGGSCLDPETPVLVAPYSMVPLRVLRVHDRVWTRPEGGGELGYHEIESVRHTTNLRQRTTLRDGRSFISSVNHLVNVRGLWRRADWLSPGEEIQGDPGGVVRDVEYLGEGPVVQLSIPTAKTYFAGDGVLHHNTLKF